MQEHIMHQIDHVHVCLFKIYLCMFTFCWMACAVYTGEAITECADTQHLHHQLHLEAGPASAQVTDPWVPVGGGPQGRP